MRIALLIAFLLPVAAIANHPEDPSPDPTATSADAAAEASSDASSNATAESSAEGGAATASPVVSAGSSVTIGRERRVRTVVGGASAGFLGDSLSMCQERNGVKNGAGLFAWGGRVTIDEFCRDCTLLIEAGYPEVCAQMIAEARGIELPARTVEAQCEERDRREASACEAK